MTVINVPKIAVLTAFLKQKQACKCKYFSKSLAKK